jgi:hypothetical protein
MKYVKTYEIFGLSEQEKVEYIQKKMDKVLDALRSRGYNFKKEDDISDVWVYKGAKFVGISPRFAEKKIDVIIYSKKELHKTISLTYSEDEICNKIISFIKEYQMVPERKKN